ncbi:hypothetical protein SEA_RIOVINA_38 [Arthrobacter phage Riovina]|uniref:Uncharacterized protein n=4 Tax=Korravirus hunterdalle TaxID=1982080 RepID=A0A3G8FWA4_9CAUD|nr:hypothetical protein SEA_ALEDEL_38 [Arthrobacter phage Aledel]AZS07723.1 hypothetical protein SEA_EUNOIA_38 [Arthrobacter phage Eunoia]AZS09185.1 hypothetical protein SEA_OMALLEY_38 [Arthrobacter phage OMalley]AZS09669.1 hypothetical protein SEA_RIOVINA_38 [Arthrobacter phage Riovina]AZS10415.1 hypothetical protein SEA_SUPAKEV_38 [Arthrobacter phage Supakev]
MPKLTKHRIALTVLENADPKDLGYIAGKLVAASMVLGLGVPKAVALANMKAQLEKEEAADLATDTDR